LGASNLKLAVKLPQGEDLNEWFASNAVDFFNQINMLFGSISDLCSCPSMSAGPKFEFLWCEGTAYKRPSMIR
jgi:MOB kinase activator 1